MGAVDEGGEVLVGAEVRVDAVEVDPPVAVVGRAVALHRELRPTGGVTQIAGEAEVLQAREPGVRVGAGPGQPLEVAAVEEAGVGRVEAVRARAAAEAARVVGRVAVR